MPRKTKPTEPAKPEPIKLELWKGRIGAMGTYMNNVAARKKWRELRQYYLNDYTKALKLKKNVDIVRINMVKDYVRTAVSELYARNPKFKCQPTGDKIIPSRIAEVAINYYWYIKKIKRQTRKTLKESKLIGYSWIKVGYEGEFGSYEDKGEINEYIKKEDIFAVYVPHYAVWYDPLAQDPPYDCRWFIHHYPKPTAKLREQYNKDIKSTSTVTFDRKKQNMLRPADVEMSTVYEIWDKENKELLLYSDGYDKGFLEEKPWQYKDGNGDPLVPFCMLDFEPETDMGKEDNIPEPEIESFIDQIFEKMKFRSIQVTHIKRFNRQIGADENKVKDSQIQKFTKGLDGAVIKTDGDPNSALAPLAYGVAQPDMYSIENRLDQDYDRISGRPGFRSGVTTQTKTRTLGELNLMDEAITGKIAEEQDIVEEFTEEVAGKLIALMRQYLKEENFARIISDVTTLDRQIFKKLRILRGGASLKYSGKSMAGEYDIEITKGSMLPLNPTNRLNYLLQIARFGPAFGLNQNSLTSMYLGQAIMKELELKDVERAYELDMKRALQPKQPTPKEQMDLIKQKQGIDNTAADTRLKKTRNEGQQIANVKKASETADTLEGKDKTKK